MPVTDSFKKHEQNIFVDREDANVKRLKTKGNLSAKNKAKTSTLKSAYKHSKSKQIEELYLITVRTNVVRAPLRKEKYSSMC